MPYGRSWTYMITYCVCSFLSMAIGSQLVHEYYKPLAGMEKLIEKEFERLKSENESGT